MRHLGLLPRSRMKELGSEVAQRPHGQVVQQFESSQLNQPNPNPDHDRTGQPVVGSDPRTAQGGRKTSRSQEIETRSFHEEAVKHDRTVQPVVGRDTNHEPRVSQTRSSHESTNFNVGDKTNHDRTEQPVVGCDASHEPGKEQSMLNEVNIDFRIPGLPHSVVKLRTLVFVNWSRRSRTTLTDILFNAIYNRTKPTIRPVR